VLSHFKVFANFVIELVRGWLLLVTGFDLELIQRSFYQNQTLKNQILTLEVLCGPICLITHWRVVFIPSSNQLNLIKLMEELHRLLILSLVK
jgi:hypothetical protein